MTAESNDHRHRFFHPAVTRLLIPGRGHESTAIAAPTPSAPLLFLHSVPSFFILAPGGQARAIPRIMATPPFPILAFKSGSSACDVPDRVGKTWPTGGVAAPRWSVTGLASANFPRGHREETLEGTTYESCGGLLPFGLNSISKKFFFDK